MTGLAGVFTLAVVSMFLAILLSVLWWRADANLCGCEYCPDGYCDFAEVFEVLLRRPSGSSFIDVLRFARGYGHAHNPLAPFGQAVLRLLVPHPVAAYMVLSLIATSTTWLAIRSSPAAAPLSSRATWVLAAAFFTHTLVLRALARPITDAVGMTATALALSALTRHRRVRTRGSAAMLVAAQFVGLFSRVSFIPMLGLPGLATLLAPSRHGHGRLRPAAVAVLAYGALPAALYLAVNHAAGTLGTLRVAWETAHASQFVAYYTWSDFWWSLAMAVQWLALPVALSMWNWRSVQHVTDVHGAWVALYVAFLLLGGGAMWPRYFLPIVPSLFLLSLPTLIRWEARSRPGLLLLLTAAVAANVTYASTRYGVATSAQQLVATPGPTVDVVRSDVKSTGEHLETAAGSAPRWMAMASHGLTSAGLAIDGALDTHWSTVAPQASGMFYQVDLGALMDITAVGVASAWPSFPREARLDLSRDAQAWAEVWRGSRRDVPSRFLDPWSLAVARFPRHTARFLRLTITRDDPTNWWAIQELGVLVTREPRTQPIHPPEP